MELYKMTIVQARNGLLKREFSVKELIEACLGRIKKLNSRLNAFITICEKETKEQAEKIDRELKNFNLTIKNKPLLGIPIALKDLYCTKGIRTTAASLVLENYIPQYDATVVSLLKEAGAIIIGKTNCDAWAHGASGENSDFGPTKNPWDQTLVPGGSSSGSAVAVASDMCLAAMGTDTGGSIRQPASFCGIVGLKPTYGRVSRYGVIAMASSLDCMGPFGKTVYDTALILKITAGWDYHDATSSNIKVDDYLKEIEKGIKGIRIGVPKEYFIEGLDIKIKEKIEKAISIFKDLGATIEEISLPHTKYALATYYIIQPSEVSSNLARYDGIRYGFSREKFGDEAKRRIMLGTYTLSAGYYDAYYLKAMKVRTLIRKDFAEAFKKVNVIVTPVSPTLPWKLGEKIDDPLAMYLSDVFTVTANLAGIPGISLPCGFVENLPVGMQILGPTFSEKTLFQVGYAYEQVTHWYKIKPKI